MTNDQDDENQRDDFTKNYFDHRDSGFWDELEKSLLALKPEWRVDRKILMFICGAYHGKLNSMGYEFSRTKKKETMN